MTKKMVNTLEYLGPAYTTKIIDGELCIYRSVGSREIEISGLGLPGAYKVALYVWDNGQISETISNIKSQWDLKEHLDTVFEGLPENPG